MTVTGRLFQTPVSATGTARSPKVESHVDEHARRRRNEGAGKTHVSDTMKVNAEIRWRPAMEAVVGKHCQFIFDTLLNLELMQAAL